MVSWSSVFDVVLPPACAICRAALPSGAAGIVCDVCEARVVPLTNPLCTRCGHPRLSVGAPLPAGASATGAPEELPPCRWCDRLPAYVRCVRSACRMDVGTGAALVHALKYDGWHAVATTMARRMARLDFPDDVVRERAALVPVPLSAVRLRERGYNQAASLSHALAARWRIPVWEQVVLRTRHTQSQVQLTPSERAGNVSSAFATGSGATSVLRGSHVLLVDDVVTTASTLNATAHALTEGGARTISYITFGRAPDPGDRTDFDFDFDQD